MTQNICDELVARIAAIGLILVQNGICTIEEIDRAVVLSRQGIDQKRAKEKEEAMEKLKSSGPIGEMLAGLFGDRRES